MNLHSERYEQRRRTWSKVHNDCSESVFVMWFVTPSVLSLMWLRDGLWPAVSDEMVVSDRRSKAETRKCLACLQSVTGPRKTGSEKMTTAKTSRYILGGGGVYLSECVSEWIKYRWQHFLYPYLSLFLLQPYLSLDVISFALWCFLFNLNFYCIFIFALLNLNWKFYKALSSCFFVWF